MAVVETYEIAEGRGVSGTARESLQYTRSFMIKIDAPNTPLTDIAQAPGIRFGDQHPDDRSVFAHSFDCSLSDDLLLYRLNVTYIAPEVIDSSASGPGSKPEEEDPDDPEEPALEGNYDYARPPADTWSGSSSVSAVPIRKDKDGNKILNTAKQPIPDLQAEKSFATLQLTRSFPTAESAATALVLYTNKINSQAWAGTPARTWKCQGGSWQKQTQSSNGYNLTYYSATFNFSYDAQQWLLEQVMIGTRDITGKNITESDVSDDGDPDKEVTEPVGLDLSGYPVKPPDEPAIVSFLVYEETDFEPAFGEPS